MQTTEAHKTEERRLRLSVYWRLAEAFERDESTDFIASEFLVSSEVFDALPARDAASTKLGRLVQATSNAFPKEGFGYWSSPPEMKRAIAILRQQLSRLATPEKARELKRAVEERDPDYFAEINI